MRKSPPVGRIHPDGHQQGVVHWQKISDRGIGMIRQEDRVQANYRKPEKLPQELRFRVDEAVKVIVTNRTPEL